jgi:alpha-L-rhamnosidase
MAKEGNLDMTLRATNLRCEYQTNPPAVDACCPRLSWELQSSLANRQQTGYQILVASSEKKLCADVGDLWDSGMVASDSSIHIIYGGKTLRSRQRCYWKVRVWDQDNAVSSWSEGASWRMGLLEEADWRGQWIGAEKQHQTGDRPAILLRREFDLEEHPGRAIATIAGLGYYELFINGRKVGDHKLDPAFTDFSKRVFYVTYDVSSYLARGKNVVGVVLGGGWYDLATPDGFAFQNSPWTSAPKRASSCSTRPARTPTP